MVDFLQLRCAFCWWALHSYLLIETELDRYIVVPVYIVSVKFYIFIKFLNLANI